MNDFVELEDILYVFEKWTLMVKTSSCNGLKPGCEVELLDASLAKLGVATLVKYLSSRNPEISAIEIDLESNPNNVKAVSYVRLIH